MQTDHLIQNLNQLVTKQSIAIMNIVIRLVLFSKYSNQHFEFKKKKMKYQKNYDVCHFFLATASDHSSTRFRRQSAMKSIDLWLMSIKPSLDNERICLFEWYVR